MQTWCFRSVTPATTADLRATESVRQAYTLLRGTSEVTSAYVGPAGLPSCNAVAFRTILDSHHPGSAFESLLAHATLEGQIYALAGIYLTNPKSFAERAAPFLDMGYPVSTQRECFIKAESVSDLVGNITSGDWPRELKSMH